MSDNDFVREHLEKYFESDNPYDLFMSDYYGYDEDRVIKDALMIEEYIASGLTEDAAKALYVLIDC